MAFNIRTRITLAVGVVVALLTISVTASFYQLVQLSQIMRAVEAVTEEIEQVSRLQLAIDRVLMPVSDYLITGRDEEREGFDRLAGEADSLFGKISSHPFLSEEERTLLIRVQGDYARLKIQAKDVLFLPNPVGSPQGTSLMKRFNATGNELILFLDQFYLLHDQALKKVRVEAARSRQRAFLHLAGSGMILGILALIFGVRLARSIIQPIRALEGGTERITAGDWDHRIEIRSGDELEALAHRFNSMAEKLGGLYRSLEHQVADRTHQVTERLEDLATLLETSTALSATIEMERLLSLMADRMAHTIQATYCRIALMDIDHPNPVIRAAYPIRMLDWEPGIGKVLDPQMLPDLQKAFETLRHVVLSPEEIGGSERSVEREQLLTPETRSALIFPLILEGRPQGVIILGEARSWEREPFSQEKIALCQTMANQAIVAITNARNYADLQEMFLSTVTAMASAIDAKSPWTRGHSERVTRYAVALGKELHLDSSILNHLRLGCILHDIGKIGTYEAILDKPDRLTDEEFSIMKQHPVRGEEILKPIRQFKPILSIVRHHHERYDGKGYPDGLKGEAIPYLARVAAVADTYDSMTADRPYRKAPGRENAIAEIKRCAGTQFDSSIAEVFVALLERGYQ